MNAKRTKYATLTTTTANGTIKEEVVPVLIHDPSSGEEPQYAYATFATTEEAEAAVASLNSQRHQTEVIQETQEVIIDEHGRPIAIHQVITEDGGSVEEVETVEDDGSHTILHIVPTGTSEGGHDDSLGSTEEYEITDAGLTEIIHRNNKTFYCPNCGNCYSAAGSLKLHMRACMRQKTEVPEDQRKCNICNRVFNSVSYLKEHMLRHTGEGPKRCQRCYRKFIDEEKYKAHMEQHKHQDKLEAEAAALQVEHGFKKMVVKEYTCSFCSQNFTVAFEAGQVKRRYACDPCREKFSNAEVLKQHKQMVDEKREFSCERCGRKFVFEGFLQRHIPTCDGTIKRRRDLK
ncbi:zinc finger protein 260 [Musca domestica]|uniref:Zinc finger protein 260 n=1 Tax=Musca domestica TaxID=7370 RepID=A0A1I8N5D4_MUSDO|nr:zinc finger protein 260 [Musca domestica]